ncbi:hypothetical protein MBAV_006055, partial [Candidatus Magnetobacterium bavaricum]
MVTMLLRIMDSWSSQDIQTWKTAVTVIAQPAPGLNRGKQESMPFNREIKITLLFKEDTFFSCKSFNLCNPSSDNPY